MSIANTPQLPAYKIIAADAVTGAFREEIPFTTFDYSLVLNGPGAFHGELALRHPKATRANLDPGRTLIHVDRGGIIVWSGFLWSVAASSVGTLKVAGEGWTSYLDRRFLKVGKDYSPQGLNGQEQTQVARDLVTYTLGVPGGNPCAGSTAGTAPITVAGSAIQPNPLPPGTPASQTVYPVYGSFERRVVGTEIDTIAKALNGFDYAIDVAYVGTVVTPTFNTYYPRRGRRLPIVLALNANATTYEQDIDASIGKLANSIDAIGAGSGVNTLIATATDTSKFATYPLIEDVRPYKSITDPARLGSQAQYDLLTTLLGTASYPAFRIIPYGDTTVGAFQVGDIVTLAGSDGYIQASGWQRIMSYVVNVDAQGAETIDLTLAPEAQAF